MRLLVVSEPYAPATHAEAYCTTRFAQAVAAAGHDVVVITREAGHTHDAVVDPSPRWSRPDGIRVIRLPSPSRLERHVRDVVAAARTGVRGMKAWHVAARAAALSEHARSPFDVVMTRHVGERTAWVGRALRRAGARWVAHFADPAPPCLHAPPYGHGEPTNAAERRTVRRLAEMLAEADALAWPCERLARHHLAALGLACERPVVIPHVGGDEGSEAGPTPRGANRSGRPEIRIVHAGLWMKDRFQPDLVRALVDAAAHADARGARLVVELLGPAPDDLVACVAAAGAADVVSFAGLVPHDACLASMRTADALLLAEAPMAEGIYLPTKLVEYATAARPVLAWSPRVGTVADVLGARHPGLMGQTYEEARAVLTRFVDAATGAPAADLAAWRVPNPERFSPATVAAGFVRDVAAIATPATP